MTRTDPAEQRRILRRTVLATLRQHTASKPGAAAALTEAVWRIVGGELASRDQQIATLQTAATCGASAPGIGADPLGPCVLRADHDGPVHQAADGAKWWPTDGGVLTFPSTMTEREAEEFRARWSERYDSAVRAVPPQPPEPRQ